MTSHREPAGRRLRRIDMSKLLTGVLPLVVTAALVLTGCGTEPDRTAAGPTGSRAQAQPSAPSGSNTPAAPSGAPTASPWPAYPAADYTYRLTASCFCTVAGVPIEITVRGGEVTRAVYARDGRGFRAGQPALKGLRLSIDDIIDKANDPGYAEVRVTWAEGEDHPSSVALDPDRRAVDEEITYAIADVRPRPEPLKSAAGRP